MTVVGILAYGSLIEDPGIELTPLIVERRTGVETPFRIEFARSSSSRCNAPTVIPVESGGSCVKATILILKAGVTPQQAEDLVWRRETRNERSEKHYVRPSEPNTNRVIVESLQSFNGIDVVLYTSIGSNIKDLSPDRIAKLAIESAKAKAGKDGKDGISYLISLKRHGISTPLMPAYESEILRLMNATSLEAALGKCLGEGV
jgi:cation transport regulator ChaC